MAPPDLQTWLLVVQDLALVVTIVGWIYTGAQQRDLLRETRAYQKQDRDLSVYRARMERASNLTASLITQSDWWFKLAALARAAVADNQPKEFFHLGMPLLEESSKTKAQLAIVLYDPQYRSLRDLLPTHIAKEIYDTLKASSLRAQAFHDKTYYMEPASPDLARQLVFVYEEGKKVGEGLVEVADRFADAFSYLDKQLTAQS